jgi:hypothetical protein
MMFSNTGNYCWYHVLQVTIHTYLIRTSLQNHSINDFVSSFVPIRNMVGTSSTRSHTSLSTAKNRCTTSSSRDGILTSNQLLVSSKLDTSIVTASTTTSAITTIVNRRDWFVRTATSITGATALVSNVISFNPEYALAVVTKASDFASTDLPPDAIRSYLQYRFALQLSIDYYVFELQDKIQDVNEWGDVSDLFVGNPTRVEREFTNVFRIVGLSMPPDISDTIRDAQYSFERSMGTLKNTVFGIRRDLPIELDKDAIPTAYRAWDNGRMALNDFVIALNTAMGMNELTPIPTIGPNQLIEYGRSQRRYVELKKKIKLCQNRGGPTLSNAWGTLMVSGYLQDSCGIPDLESYFYQT